MFNEVSTFSCSNHQSPEIQSIEKIIHYCEYGCGNKAHFKLSNGKWYCSKRYNLCPSIQKGKKNNEKNNRICPICNKELYFRSSNFIQHVKSCKRKQKDKLKVYKKICPKCGKEFQLDHFHRFNEYCSKLCANRKSTINNKGKKKIVKCKYCNCNILIGKNATDDNHMCHSCYKKSRKRKCRICGQLEHPRPELCKKYNIIPTLIKYFNFNKDKLGSIEVYSEFERIKNLLEVDYYTNHLSSIDLAKKYNYKYPRNFCNILCSLDIKIRNLQEAINNYVENSPNYIVPHYKKSQYKHGWHTTWNGKNVYYRSNNELTYAKELDSQQIDYEMESLRIKYFDTNEGKWRRAIPDFYIPSTNTIIEIKSEYTLNIQNMKDKMHAFIEKGFKFKLIVDFKEVNLLLPG